MECLSIFLTLLISQALSLPQTSSPTQTLSATTLHTITQSQVTQEPSVQDLRARQAGNTCGYFNDIPITCSAGIPCTYDSYINVKYCSPAGSLPVTTIFNYGYWPLSGCASGQICCPIGLSQWAEYVFPEDNNALLFFCNTAHGTLTAYNELSGNIPTSPTTSYTTTTSYSTTESTTESTTSPTTSPTTSTPSPVTSPSQSPSSSQSSGGFSESDKIALGVGIGVGLPATIAAIVTCIITCGRRQG